MNKLTSYALACTAAFTLAASTGCKPGLDFKQAIPKKETLSLNVPAGDGQALTVGELSGFYGLTLGIAASVNIPVFAMFLTIEAIVASEPTEQDENHAVWGPSEPKGLQPLSHKFTVVKEDEETYSYKLEARKKGETGDFTVVFEGEAKPAEDGRGTGTLTWHLGSQRNLLVSDCDLIGDITIDYDANEEPRVLDVHFDGVADECNGEEPHDAHYTYTEAEDASGTMDFAIEGNMHRDDEAKPLHETVAVRSRWLGDGQGRSDVQISGGEVATDLDVLGEQDTVDVVECWDASFALSYADATPAELAPALDHETTGDASTCAFAEAEFASL